MSVQIRIPIIEGSKNNSYSTRYNRLSHRTQKILRIMGKVYKAISRRKFAVSDLRGRGLGTWREVADSFYELESRGFGAVRQGNLGPVFSAYPPVLQSMG